MSANARIGILLETGEAAVADALPPDGFESQLGEPDEVVVCRAESWTGRDASTRIADVCREKDIDRVVIAGPSSGAHLGLEWIEREDGQPWLPVTWAPIREQCAWIEPDLDARRAKIQRLLEMAVARARGGAPIDLADVPVKRTVAVAGGNHAAFQTAAVLLDAGFPVVLIQGGAADGCFLPVPPELIERVQSHPAVQIIADAAIERVTGHVGNFRLHVGAPGQRPPLEVGALVVAVDAQICPLAMDGVLDAPGRVEALRDYGAAVSNGGTDARSACIWLDRDGLDRRCAGQAALAFALAHARQGGKPYVLFRQAPVYGAAGQMLYDQARAAGVTAIRYDAPPRFRVENGGVRVSVTDLVLPDGMLEFAVDRVVAPAPVRAPASHARLAAMLRQPLDLQGRLQPGNVRHRPVGAARRGVYFVGGCHDECDPEQAAQEARAVLADLMARLPGDTVRTPVERVTINPGKCAACLTCYRSCPHGAIRPTTMDRRLGVLDAACWQCGICAAACPGQALEHGSLRFSQMHETLKAATADLLGRPPIVAFACRTSAVPAADAAGAAGLNLPTDVLLVDVPCAGLVSEQIVLDAFEQGARGVLVLGCHEDNCRSLWGSDLSRKRVGRVRRDLDAIGALDARLEFHTVAANEPHRLAHLLAEACDRMPAGRIGD